MHASTTTSTGHVLSTFRNLQNNNETIMVEVSHNIY